MESWKPNNSWWSLKISAICSIDLIGQLFRCKYFWQNCYCNLFDMDRVKRSIFLFILFFQKEAVTPSTPIGDTFISCFFNVSLGLYLIFFDYVRDILYYFKYLSHYSIFFLLSSRFASVDIMRHYGFLLGSFQAFLLPSWEACSNLMPQSWLHYCCLDETLLHPPLSHRSFFASFQIPTALRTAFL